MNLIINKDKYWVYNIYGGKEMNIKIKITVLITYVAMILVNSLANILPINNINTGDVSDYYGNLFAPAAITFAIWGLIYVLLAAFTLYQFFNIRIDPNKLNKIGIIFSVSSIANLLWIFAWHYLLIQLTLPLMLIMLISLILIAKELKNTELEGKEKLLVKAPFSVYYGWITVATIANVTALLVGINWNGFGLSEALWTVIILIVGAIIGSVTTLYSKDYFYGLVLVWAYVGILIKHNSSEYFAGEYNQVVITIVCSLVVLVISNIYVIIKGARN